MKKIYLLKLVSIYTIIILTSLQFCVSSDKQKPNTTILISLDGFRYDYLDRGVTPTLAKIAKDGVRAAYLQPVFPSSTFPNHISIITGLYPTNHGIVANKFIDTNSNEIYSIGSKVAADPKWYYGEPFWLTCKKNNVVSASYFWPSSDLNDSSRNPNYFEKYEHKRDYLKRVNGVFSWIDLPEKLRPAFITLYFDSPDSFGHSNGTNSSELNKKLAELDSVINYMIKGLESRNILKSTNIIILSDHGMKDFNINTVINTKNLFPAYYADIINNSSCLLVYPKPGYDDSVRISLSKHSQNYRFYHSDSLPKIFSVGPTSRLGKYVVIADCGWIFTEKTEWDKKYVATHGFDNRCLEMQGIFFAVGPDFKQSYSSIGLRNIDVYPLLCKIFNFDINHEIDGDLQKIEHILK